MTKTAPSITAQVPYLFDPRLLEGAITDEHPTLSIHLKGFWIEYAVRLDRDFQARLDVTVYCDPPGPNRLDGTRLVANATLDSGVRSFIATARDIAFARKDKARTDKTRLTVGALEEMLDGHPDY